MEIIKIIKPDLKPMFEMAKLTRKHSSKRICNDFGEYIYFSEVQAGHSPRIKFYGGTSETRATTSAPSYTITRNGAGQLELENWMTKKNCPNAFDDNYLAGIKSFINNHVAVLLLVWFCRLDEADALTYFEGTWSWDNLLESINCEASIAARICDVQNEEELHKFCLDNNLYTFKRG